MLTRFTVENFRSIGAQQEIVLSISAKDVLDDSARKTPNETPCNLVAAVVGHNASGKTTALQALAFLFWFIENSYTKLKPEDSIPADKHSLHKDKPIIMTAEFEAGEWSYEYRIELEDKEVSQESLVKKGRGRPTELFSLVRDGGRTNIELTDSIKLNETDRARFEERKNVALLSSLIGTGYLSDIHFFNRFYSNLEDFGAASEFDLFTNVMVASRALFRDQNLRDQILNVIRAFDLGISEFSFFEIPQHVKGDKTLDATPILQGVHQAGGTSFSLPIWLESNGTQRGLCLLRQIFPILETGGVVILDEIDAGLHPYMIKKIISLFENESSNPKNAQLIFSTHQHLLLNDRTKTQIFITEKSEDKLETEIFRLDEVSGVRNDENYFHKYIAGAYGGTPRFSWL